MAKNKVKPHGDSNNTTENYNKKKTNHHLFKSQNTNNNNIVNNNKNNQQKYTNNNHSKFKNGGKIEKKYNKNNKQQFGAKIRNNKVDDVENTNKTSTLNENKKVFDKKTWRLKKYSKKYKLQQWEEKRKKALLTEYYKQLKNEDDTNKFDVNKIYEEYFDSDEERQTNPKVNYVTNPNFKLISNSGGSDKEDRWKSKENVNSEDTKNINEIKSPKKKLSAYHRAQLEYQRLQDEKIQKKEDMLRQKAEREEALKKYKKNKMEKYKKLSKKTRKGQPIMADRMEMLLEKIQSTSV